MSGNTVIRDTGESYISHTMKEFTPMPDHTFPINVFYLQHPVPFPVHWHEHFELVYVVSGTATMQTDAQFFPIQQGDLVFVSSKQLHAVSEDSEDVQIVCIVFNESLLRNGRLDNTDNRYIIPMLDSKMPIRNQLDTRNAFVQQVIKSIDTLIMEFYLKNIGFELVIKSELFKIFALIIRYLSQLMTEGQLFLPQENNRNGSLSSLLTYIQNNLSSHITVADAARRVNLSPNHFCRVFKKLTGTTLISYVHLLRVQEAENLLSKTNCSISEIAETLGFGSITHFERVFHKYKKTTPNGYRSTSAGKSHLHPSDDPSGKPGSHRKP